MNKLLQKNYIINENTVYDLDARLVAYKRDKRIFILQEVFKGLRSLLIEEWNIKYFVII